MKLVEKTDGNGNIVMVEDPDWMDDECHFKKHRKKITNLTPKKKKRKK